MRRIMARDHHLRLKIEEAKRDLRSDDPETRGRAEDALPDMEAELAELEEELRLDEVIERREVR